MVNNIARFAKYNRIFYPLLLVFCEFSNCWNISITRLHSSKMHTARLLTVSPSMHCARGVPGPGRCVCSRGVCSWGVVCSGGCLVSGGVVSQHALRQTPACEQNSWHTLVKILPCPKLRLRTVINNWAAVFKLFRSYFFFFCYHQHVANAWNEQVDIIPTTFKMYRRLPHGTGTMR